MRYKRRVYYSVYIPDHWYFPKLKKWIHCDNMGDEQYKDYDFQNHQKFINCKVFRINWPIGTTILKQALHKGKFLWTDYDIVI